MMELEAIRELACEMGEHSERRVNDADPTIKAGAIIEGVCADRLKALLPALEERIAELDGAFKCAKQQMALALKGRVDAEARLAEAQAQVAVVDRGLGDLGDTSAQAALDAYVQEKVKERMAQEFKEYLERVRQYEIEWQAKLDRARLEGHIDEAHWWAHAPDQMKPRRAEVLHERAANRAKVTAADPPKEKP